MRQHLTDLAIKQLPHPDSGDKKYWDTNLPGFGVRVTARTKSFFVVRGKKRQLTTLGPYPTLSLQDARKAAKRLLVQEPEESVVTSLPRAIATYLEAIEAIEATVRPSSLTVYRRYLAQAPDIPLAALKKN